MGLRLAVERPGDDPFQGDLYALPPENYYLPELDFDQAELSALQTCLYLLEGQFAYAEPLRLALQHLTLGRPSPLDDHAARTVSVNLLGGDYSPEVAAHLTKIESAISRRKTIRFTYYSIGRDERSEREVDPYSLMYSAGQLVHRRLLPRARRTRASSACRASRGASPSGRAPSTTSRAPQRLRPLALPRPRARGSSTTPSTPRPSRSPRPSPGGSSRCSAPTASTAIGADGSGIYTTTTATAASSWPGSWASAPRRRCWSPPTCATPCVAALELVGDRHRGRRRRALRAAAAPAGDAPARRAAEPRRRPDGAARPSASCRPSASPACSPS